MSMKNKERGAINITEKNIDKLLGSNKPMVIDFWAEWCTPCKMISPLIDDIADKYSDKVIIGKCNVEDNDGLATKYSIRNIPAIIFINNGEIADRHVGILSKDKLEEKLNTILDNA